MADSYHSERDTQNVLQLRAILKDFPPFARQYFLAQEASKETRTRLSYAYDIRTFFQFLLDLCVVQVVRVVALWCGYCVGDFFFAQKDYNLSVL